MSSVYRTYDVGLEFDRRDPFDAYIISKFDQIEENHLEEFICELIKDHMIAGYFIRERDSEKT